MKRFSISTVMVAMVAVLMLGSLDRELWARGGGGGGGARGGARPSGGGGGGARSSFGGGGAAAHTPSLSRPSGGFTAGHASMPNMGAKPNLGAGGFKSGGAQSNLPNLGNNRPSPPNAGGGAARPNLPNAGGNHSNFPGAGGARPNLPGSGGNRPGDAGFSRPSQGQLNDFLGLPGGAGNHPNMGGNHPNVGPGNRLPGNIAGGNVNVGNRVTVNRQNNINSMRNHWTNVNNRPFDNNYWGRHPMNGPGWGWHAGWGRYPGNWAWRAATWGAFLPWLGWNIAQPYSYNYGTNVVYQDGSVYMNGQPYATADQYYQQAASVSQAVPPNVDPANVEWMPLGVFAVAEQDGTDTGMVMQLAVSKEGILAGTFYNETTNVSRPLEGTVDRTSQRAAWHFADGKNTDVVMETGVNSLTQDESTALVHFGPDKAETWTMVRLPEPQEAKS